MSAAAAVLQLHRPGALRASVQNRLRDGSRPAAAARQGQRACASRACWLAAAQVQQAPLAPTLSADGSSAADEPSTRPQAFAAGAAVAPQPAGIKVGWRRESTHACYTGHPAWTPSRLFAG